MGYDEDLLRLSDTAISTHKDFLPCTEIYDKVKMRSFYNIDKYYDVIMGDGVINFCGSEIVDYVSRWCGTFVVRFFVSKETEKMKYFDYFLRNTHFRLPDEIFDSQPNCKILVWNFKKYRA